MSRFEGLVQTACSHHGPSAKWSVYLIFTSAVASRLVISCTGYCVEWVRKKWPFQYIRSKVCQATSPYPSKSNKSQNTICVNINSEGTLKSRIHGFLQKGSLELKLSYLKRICEVFLIINHCQNCWRIFPLFDLLERLVWKATHFQKIHVRGCLEKLVFIFKLRPRSRLWV